MSRNVDQIAKDFPVLFRKKIDLAIGEGWYQLVYDLATGITLEAQKRCIPIDSDTYPWVRQVKEKFGALRFYMSCANAEMRTLVETAEEQSYTICEQCGEPGEIRCESWRHVACDTCEEKIKQGRCR